MSFIKAGRQIAMEPKLSGKDLRDYFWISRDQLEKSISGSSLIPTHIRTLCKELIDHGSGTILQNTVSKEVVGTLNNDDIEILLSLLEKELLKSVDNAILIFCFVSQMHYICSTIETK